MSGIDLNTWLSISAGSAVAMAFAYFPIAMQLSTRVLVSPYPKADLTRRACGAATDGILVALAAYLYWISGAALYLFAGGAYLLLRDAVRGQSIGKLWFGLVVISVETGQPCSISSSIRRNLLLLMPGANLVAAFLEVKTLVGDPQGQRVGDKLAQTQVVAGYGAKELAKWFQKWLMDVGGEFGRSQRRRRRAPSPIDRAACLPSGRLPPVSPPR